MWLIPRPRSRKGVAETVEALSAALANGSHDANTIRPYLTAVMEAADRDRLGVDEKLALLLPLLGEPYDEATALVAVGCGALVEYGAAAEPLRQIAHHGIRRTLTEPDAGDGCLDLWIRVACAVGQRVPAVRQALTEDEAVLQALTLRGTQDHVTGPLLMLLQLPSRQPMLVMHPETERGYWVEVDGVADNFQLHVLLAAALIGAVGDGWLPGTAPPADVVRACTDPTAPQGYEVAAGWFNLVNWTGWPQADAGGDVDGGHWIWNEGHPADIATLDGMPVVVLTTPPYARSWHADRMFKAVPAAVRVTSQLDADGYAHWADVLSRAATAGD